jgi:hypothetical protein
MKLRNNFIYGLYLVFIIFIVSILSSLSIKREGLENNDIENTFKQIIEKIKYEINLSQNNEYKLNALLDALDYTNYIKSTYKIK